MTQPPDSRPDNDFGEGRGGYDAPDREPAPTAPAVRPPRWSGAKTAVTAALAISVASGGAIAAATALPQGTSADAGPADGRPGVGKPGQQPPWLRGYATDGQHSQHNPAPGSAAEMGDGR